MALVIRITKAYNFFCYIRLVIKPNGGRFFSQPMRTKFPFTFIVLPVSGCLILKWLKLRRGNLIACYTSMLIKLGSYYNLQIALTTLAFYFEVILKRTF